MTEILEHFKTDEGNSLLELSHAHPLLIVFLRHLGCPFCRETLSDLKKRRAYLNQRGIRLALVHMASDEEAGKLFDQYGLGDAIRISDPERNLYRSFGLMEGTWGQVMGPKVWWRGFVTAVLRGEGWGRVRGDVRQMPGVFLVHKGSIVSDFRHKTSADRPDYGRFVNKVSP